jgi:hypothetical protein
VGNQEDNVRVRAIARMREVTLGLRFTATRRPVAAPRCKKLSLPWLRVSAGAEGLEPPAYGFGDRRSFASLSEKGPVRSIPRSIRRARAILS